MYISKLKIKNFKCFKEVEIDFDPNFNLIIGENNGGKSTIFEALRLWQIAIQQFYTERTGKKGDGSLNMGFYKSYSFKPLQISDLSFLRIENLNNVLHDKTLKTIEDDSENEYNENNSFSIELVFSDSINFAAVPIIFRTNNKNTLSCKLLLSGLNNSKDKNEKELIKISHSLSKVMDLSNNATFKNRIRLAYIPPKFTLPNKEVLISERNALILEKLIMGESQLVIRNILHHWCSYGYQIKTKKTNTETINNAKNLLKKIIQENNFKENFEKNIKPYIESVLEYNIQPKRNQKSKFLKEIEIGIKEILGQSFDFISDNDPIDDYSLQIKNDKDKTEIAQLGSGTVNILNILTVLNYNEQTIDKAATKCNILLLDEPDSHLHSNLQINLFKYLATQSKENSKQIFIITHNSSLISQFDTLLYVQSKKKQISPIPINDYVENYLRNLDVNQANVIKELNEAKTQKDSLLKQLDEIKNINKPLLFTEGPSDIIIIKNAFTKLYPSEEMPFHLINGFSCTQLKNTFENEETFEKNNLYPQIALFDFDEAYNQWKGLWKKDNFTILNNNNPFLPFVKKHNNFNAYAILLPVPDIEQIKKQVIKTNALTFEGKSVLSIEHLFYGVEKLEDAFKLESAPGGNLVVFNKDKMIFAEGTSNLTKDDFKHFIPLFNKIANIIGVELPN